MSKSDDRGDQGTILLRDFFDYLEDIHLQHGLKRGFNLMDVQLIMAELFELD